MKKLISIIIGLIIIAPSTFAYYETTERAEVLSINTTNRNMVLERGDEKWLIHYVGNCGDHAEVGDNVVLAIRSDLDGYGDYLKASSYNKCEIDQAEEITGTIHINYVFNNNTMAGITDEDGEIYTILVKKDCTKILGFMYKDIYYKKYDSLITQGDKIFLPRNSATCTLQYVKHEEKDIEDKKIDYTGMDVQIPSTVYDVNAVAGDGKVYLNWKKANDNVAIDHYIVSYSGYSFDASKYDPEDMPNQVIVKENRYVVDGLYNENTYYFYVLAVDTSGNMSSSWSTVASAEPRSSIHDINTEYERVSVRIFQLQDTGRSYLFRWNKIPLFNRQSIILEADRGERLFAYTEWGKDYVRILKNAERKGKKLKLIVKQYDTYGQMFTDEYDFDF
ncbi:fibronectin type III domain-containing protein [Candidatus Peregrinibacteria bacterium]|nr:fibronectin type III domain-containing protein [Candidatus Peregrinibacteria bacterium]